MKWKCRYCNKDVYENIYRCREINELKHHIHIHFCSEECKTKYLKEKEEKRFCCYCGKHYQTEKIAREHEKSCILNPDNVKICPKCEKEHNNKGIYCSRKCANIREHSEETKKKITKSMKNYHKYHIKLNYVSKDKEHILKCLNCDKEFKSKKLRQKFCSLSCNGIYNGWRPRHKNYHSYAEKFWIRVLGNNNIFYFNEFIVREEQYRTHWYSIDFALVKNNKKIALEIDDSQHKYKDRKESDIKKDYFLNSKNWIVYRVEWNEINTDRGKELMKQKIDDFLKFYESL